jgi:phenylpyruvate tautomerase PptA (4-oxalocrotonate tautomerase family)
MARGNSCQGRAQVRDRALVSEQLGWHHLAMKTRAAAVSALKALESFHKGQVWRIGDLNLAVTSVGKTEKYVMVIVSQSDILMSGQPGHAAFVDLRSIGGLSDGTNRKLTERICDALEESLAIPPDRVYAIFADVQASHWGWNGATFG